MQENTDWLINRENSIGNSKDIYVRGKKVGKIMEEKNKTNTEEDIKILNAFIKCIRSDLEEEDEGNFEIAQAIENILADRNNIASKYNNLIYKIEEKIKENKEYLQHANTMYEYTEKDVINTVIEVLKLLEKENE